LGQRLKSAEVVSPAVLVEIAQPDSLGPLLIQEPWDGPRKSRRFDRIVEVGAELEDFRIGSVQRHRQSSRSSVPGSSLVGKLDS
jgi:uncharacterized protein YecE (DUF72 family)